MGYETKIIIVKKTSGINEIEGLYFAEKIAEFNLYKTNYKGPYMKSVPMMRVTNCYYYMDELVEWKMAQLEQNLADLEDKREEERKRARMREDLLARLTPEERELLGV